mgnify:CR=1 FL=1
MKKINKSRILKQTIRRYFDETLDLDDTIAKEAKKYIKKKENTKIISLLNQIEKLEFEGNQGYFSLEKSIEDEILSNSPQTYFSWYSLMNSKSGMFTEYDENLSDSFSNDFYFRSTNLFGIRIDSFAPVIKHQLFQKFFFFVLIHNQIFYTKMEAHCKIILDDLILTSDLGLSAKINFWFLINQIQHIYLMQNNYPRNLVNQANEYFLE